MMPTDPRKNRKSVAIGYLSRNTQVYELAIANEQLCCNLSFSKPTRVPGKPFCPKVPGGPRLPLGPWSKDKIKIQPIFTELHNVSHVTTKSSWMLMEAHIKVSWPITILFITF